MPNLPEEFFSGAMSEPIRNIGMQGVQEFFFFVT